MHSFSSRPITSSLKRRKKKNGKNESRTKEHEKTCVFRPQTQHYLSTQNQSNFVLPLAREKCCFAPVIQTDPNSIFDAWLPSCLSGSVTFPENLSTGREMHLFSSPNDHYYAKQKAPFEMWKNTSSVLCCLEQGPRVNSWNLSHFFDENESNSSRIFEQALMPFF